MKLLVVTNLSPLDSNPNAGIFVARRLQHYKSFGVDFDAISLGLKDGKIVTAIKKLLQRPSYEPLEEHEGVKFKPVLINRNLRMALMNKISRGYFVKIAELLVRTIEQLFDLKDVKIFLVDPVGLV